ncbi:MAG: CoA transferase [Chloroflexi bacterium]|nr:CoA transferase [Chloroflexota bacterium]
MAVPLPFDGLKVVDISWVIVGPTTVKYLADHGATTVRVEAATPLDILRTAGPFKDGVPGPDRTHFFGDINASKLGLCVDLKNPAGLDIAKRLISWADVFIESFTPGTVDSLGIGYETARQLNPSIVMASTCLMGQTGPAAAFSGYGFHAASIAGFYETTGWPDLAPDGPWTAYTDAVSPRILAATIMAALDHRRRTGQGQYIDASQLEMSLHFLSPQIMDYGANGRGVTRNGNRSRYFAPQGAYPCAGDDRWCTIAVETEEQWEALQRAMGGPAWAQDEGLGSMQGRLDNHDTIDQHIGEWTRDKEPKALMQLLLSHGVPAGVVQRSSDLETDPQLAHRNYFRPLEHQEMGTVPYAGHQFRIRGYDSGPRFPAPVLGQHNEQVLREILGMTDDEVAEAVIAEAIL